MACDKIESVVHSHQHTITRSVYYVVEINSCYTHGKLQVKEKKSSDASLLRMNPVASGDNVATGLNSAHKLKEELPPLVPCCEGRELQVRVPEYIF